MATDRETKPAVDPFDPLIWAIRERQIKADLKRAENRIIAGFSILFFAPLLIMILIQFYKNHTYERTNTKPIEQAEYPDRSSSKRDERRAHHEYDHVPDNGGHAR